VAKSLGAPLDAFVVRKIGVPGRPELAMGAVATGGIRVRNDDVILWHRVTDETFVRVAATEEVELARRERAYRGEAPPPDLEGKVVLLVDDGLATGASMRAAVSAVALRNPARIVVAVPVAAPDACLLLEKQGAEVVCPLTPRWFGGVGRFYRDFGQTSDEEVRRLLGAA
jgi:putative phosphoribosyl transferase